MKTQKLAEALTHLVLTQSPVISKQIILMGRFDNLVAMAVAFGIIVFFGVLFFVGYGYEWEEPMVAICIFVLISLVVGGIVEVVSFCDLYESYHAPNLYVAEYIIYQVKN